MEIFSDRLKIAIKKAGYSRSEFAEKSGVGTSVLTKWLSGKLTPKSNQLLRLARVADVSMEWLLTGETEGPIPMAERVEAGLKMIKKNMPGFDDDPEEVEGFRRLLLDVFESDDERRAAKGPGGGPDLLALGDMLESASQEFDQKFNDLAEALGDDDGVSDIQTKGNRVWEEALVTLKRLNRRIHGLISEIRARNEPPEW